MESLTTSRHLPASGCLGRIRLPGRAILAATAAWAHRASLPLWKTRQPGLNPVRPYPDRTAAARVLVAEHHPATRDVLVRTLHGLGIHPDAAATGREAIDMFRRLHYDLVLIDRWMPGLDGPTTTAAIRRDEGARHTVVVAMSTEMSHEDHDRFMDCGTDDILLKPVHGEGVARVLRKWLPRNAPLPDVALSAPAPRR